MLKDPSGILLIDKPEGVTSHDVVACVRKNGHFSKVGHAGTLDPLATGLLVLLVGGATHYFSFLMQGEKSYEAIVTLGVSTETGDREGRITRSASYEGVTLEKVQKAFETLQGPQEQIPPMYSAIKYQGKRLYQMVRRGVSVERRPRPIFIRTLELLAFHPPTLSFFLVCSKGTYVRALVETMGEKWGCPSHLSALRRVQSGFFSVAEAVLFEKVRRLDRSALLPFLRELPASDRSSFR
ncbi:MAG: tRNA pseudouridine(55) synthase TruB [Candidatus Omnitrophica bacterium]|nr:tRNA pseudouridine(55) synthase TruB [Candidatus Omnitrophota bacterium]